MTKSIPVNLPFERLPASATDPGTHAALDEARARIAEIDAIFEEASGWGSWMVEAANEREALATKFGLPQKWQARTGSGHRTD